MGRGSGTQKIVYQNWPNQISPIVNFVFSHDGHFGLEGVGGLLLRLSAVLMLAWPDLPVLLFVRRCQSSIS